MSRLFYLIGGIFLLALVLYTPRALAIESKSVTINEVMWTGSTKSSHDEWIELKNNTEEEIDFSGWEIAHAGSGGQSITISHDQSSKIVPRGYFIISKYSFRQNPEKTILAREADFVTEDLSLANSDNGDLVIKDTNGQVIDQAIGTAWPAGDNSKKYSMERITNCLDGLSVVCWHTARETKGFVENAHERGSPSYENSLPLFHIPDDSSQISQYINLDQSLTAKADVTAIIDGDTIEVNLDDEIVKVRLIGLNSPESSRSSDFGIDEPYYQEAREFTQENLLGKTVDLLISQNPRNQYDNYDRLLAAVIDRDDLFNIKLLSQGLAKTYYLDNEIIKSSQWLAEELQAQEKQLGIWHSVDSSEVHINEIMPSPIGPDSENEWIEFYNSSNKDINLGNWFLDDAEDGSKPYLLPSGTTIKANEYLVISVLESKISLNNNGDSVRLFKPDLSLVEEIIYPKAPEGQSYSQLDHNWQWSSTPTKGYANVFAEDRTSNVGGNNEITLPIKDIRNLPANTQVTTTGIVTVPPGILANQYFYIQDEESGIQIYSYNKLFPSLSIGDKIKVTGKISASEIKRIKISQPEDILLLEKGKLIKPKEIFISEINHELEGQLVKIKGQIVKLSGNNIYLTDGDSQIVVQIRKSANFARPKMKKGDLLEAVGIVYLSKGKFYLLPRFLDDFKIEPLISAAEEKKKARNKFIKTAQAAEANYQDRKILGVKGSNLDDILYINNDNGLSLLNNLKNWIKSSELVIISTIVLLILWMTEWLWPRKLLPKM